MAVSDSARELVFQVVDANQEYNTKLLVLFSMLGYCLAMFFLSFYLEKHNEMWQDLNPKAKLSRLLLKYFFRWISGVYIFIFLLMFLIMYRTVPLERLLNLVFGLFIPFMGAFGIWGIVYWFELILDLTGVRIENGQIKKAKKTRRNRNNG